MLDNYNPSIGWILQAYAVYLCIIFQFVAGTNYYALKGIFKLIVII
jgi:hypothetical protein